MSEEKKEVALYQLPASPVELEAAFIDEDFVTTLIDSISKKAKAVVGDMNTVKGRGVYISMARDVRSSKAAIDEAGKKLVAEMKKRPALVDESRRKIREALDELAVEIRKPVTDYEAEQERIKAEEEARIAAEKLVAEIEMAHREALIDNYEFDRALEESKAEDERKRIAYEQELQQQAADKAKREAAEAVRLELEAAAQRETALKAATEKAERDRVEEQERMQREAKEAADKAERDKKAAIEAEQLKARQEADRIKREAEQKEAARLAEEKRIADEAAARAADVENRKKVNNQALADFVAAGLSEECAKLAVTAIAKSAVRAVRITY